MTAFVLLRIETDSEARDLIEDMREYPDSPILTPCLEHTVYATIASITYGGKPVVMGPGGVA